MDDTTIYISEEGNLSSIYSDNISWKQFGVCQIVRLSNVEFSEKQQCWIVEYIDGSKIYQEFTLRESALCAEIREIKSAWGYFSWLGQVAITNNNKGANA